MNANRLVKAPTPQEASPHTQEPSSDTVPELDGTHIDDTPPQQERPDVADTSPTGDPRPLVTPSTQELAAPPTEIEETSAPKDAQTSEAHSQGVLPKPIPARKTRTHRTSRAEERPTRESRRQSKRKVAQRQRLYEVGGLVDAGVDNEGNELYKALWAGYGPKSDTWEPAEGLPDALIREYKRSHGLG